MMEDLKSIADYLQLLLRYLVSGVVSVMIIAMLDDASYNMLLQLMEKSIWIIVAASGVLGLLTYALHQAALDKFLYGCSIWFYGRKIKFPQILLDSKKITVEKVEKDKENFYQLTAETIRKIRFELFSQTYLRRSRKDERVQLLQRELDSKLALLNFLYCASYSCLSISTIMYARYVHLYCHSTSECFQHGFHVYRLFGVFAFGWLLFFSAFYLDYRTTKREMWLVENFFQTV